MTIEQYSLGFDEDGITEVSLSAIKEIADKGMILEKVEIAGNGPSGVITSFIFKDHGIYNASGFSVGYGGEGPHGLHTAIRLFHPDKLSEDFWETAIAELNPDSLWAWKPSHGFISEK
jgi:hypothetical protein